MWQINTDQDTIVFPLVTRQDFAPFKKLPFKNFKKLQMYLLVGKTKIPYDFTFLVE